MNDARLQVAFGGLHPDRVSGLHTDYGPVGTMRRLEAGAIKTTDRARWAVAIPAADRRRELQTSGISVIYRGEPGHAQELGLLRDAPDLLFVRGELGNGPAVAVVGTRRCTSYGRRVAEIYGRATAGAGWRAVSMGWHTRDTPKAWRFPPRNRTNT